MLAILLVLGFIMQSGVLKTDNEYYDIYTINGCLYSKSSYSDYNGKKKHIRSRRKELKR